jgi:hypothetical protein
MISSVTAASPERWAPAAGWINGKGRMVSGRAMRHLPPKNPSWWNARPHLYPLPPGEDFRFHGSGFANDYSSDPVACFSKRRRTILPLPGEKADPSPAGAGEGGQRPGEGSGVITVPWGEVGLPFFDHFEVHGAVPSPAGAGAGGGVITIPWVEVCFEARPHLYPLPQERISVFTAPVLRTTIRQSRRVFFKKTANDSPSPRGRGPG